MQEQLEREHMLWDIPKQDLTKPFVIRGLEPKIPISYKDWNENCFTEKLVHYCNKGTYEYESQETSEFIESVKSGTFNNNLLTEPIAKSYWKNLAIPNFIKDDLIKRNEYVFDYYHLQWVFTPPDTYTPSHIDSWGLCGWMYLLEGKKTFQMWDLSLREQLFNVEAEKLHDPRIFPLPTEKDIPPACTITIGAKDLIWIPAGWIHNTYTSEKAFGYGGGCALSQTLHFTKDVRKFERETFTKNGVIDEGHRKQALLVDELVSSNVN